MKTLHGYDKIITKGHTSRRNSLLCPYDTTMHCCDIVLESLYEFKNLWLVFDKTFSNGKMSYVTIVDLAEMIKLGIQSFFIWGHLVSHLSKFDQVKFGQMKKQHFDSSIMNSKCIQIEKFWIPSLLNSSISTIVVLVNLPFEIVWIVQICDF